MVQGNRQGVEQILAELLEIATKPEGSNSELNYRLASFLLSMWTEDYPALMEHSKFAKTTKLGVHSQLKLSLN